MILPWRSDIIFAREFCRQLQERVVEQWNSPFEADGHRRAVFLAQEVTGRYVRSSNL